ncbi:hypothetical protein AJ80_04413 [Polytolypa hystricis UAMH7299]|uniref:Uncharacterized protein n=1 Tax=Polytolypa hystricis (strain UAMH7299) TaxID=1447883 RepID=A0A2B7YBL9_POLH7|nr:hypothetical protein AJ80_04413 [Polytolypa hystricis UAMH7299]
MAIAIAAPISLDSRSDTQPAMTNGAGDVVPFDSARVVPKK